MSEVSMPFSHATEYFRGGMEAELKRNIKPQLMAVAERIVNDCIDDLCKDLRGRITEFRDVNGHLNITLILDGVRKSL